MSIKHVAALLAAVAAVTVPVASAAGPSVTTTIASASASDFRAVVTATKTTDGGAPPATVKVAAFEKSGGSWKALGQARVGRSDGFFWKVLTGPRAIREFSISTSAPDRVSVQLLVSPALGWSPVYHFHVRAGRLVAG